LDPFSDCSASYSGWSLFATRYLDMGGYGLVSILGWTYFAGLVLVVVGFGIELMRTPLRSPNLLVLVLLLVLFLYGNRSGR